MGVSLDLRNVGRAILMGSAIGVGVAGCTLPQVGTAPTEQQSTQRDLDYNQALTTRDPARVTKFVETYGSSSQAARLLNQMPAEVLANVPRTAVLGLSEGTKRQLTPRVRGQFNIPMDTGGSSNSGTSSGGYG